MECVICKNGTNINGKVTVTLERDGSIVLIKDVPAMVCNNCGHYYLDEKTATYVMQKGNESLQKGSELEMFRLQMA
jgi:YgiT-type zinc finger domain-containing protein